MKKVLMICMLGLLAVGFTYSQDWENPEVLERLGLEKDDVEQVREIFEKTEKEIRQARIELDILKAQLRKLLFEEQVNMREVERQLRQSLEWELKQRMAHIRRQVQLRELLGDAKYARLTEAMEKRRQWTEQERRVREETEKGERQQR